MSGSKKLLKRAREFHLKPDLGRPMNSALRRQNYATILGNSSIDDVKFSAKPVSDTLKFANSFNFIIDPSMVWASHQGIPMPSEGAILSDNDPRKAATKELRSLTNTPIYGCPATMGHERSRT
jgi:hypothetical protein